MKMYKLFLGVVAIAAMTTFVSCEGPAGPAGPQGEKGDTGATGATGAQGEKGDPGDVTVTCLACHDGTIINEVKAEFYQSDHYLGQYVAAEGTRGSCAQCHSGNGFIEYATLGAVEGSTLNNPVGWTCETCHGIHQKFNETLDAADDYALRKIDPVTWIIDDTKTVDFGGPSNLCVNCHQARTAEPNTASPGTEFAITSSHYGPHHGPQGNVIAGFGFAEIAGSTAYPAAESTTHFSKGCVECHMYDYADGAGGHTFNPAVAACQQCHTTDNFDYSGIQTNTEEKMAELVAKLYDKGVVDTAGGSVSLITGTYPMVVAQAYYNYAGLEADRSMGVHNPKYVTALLNNSIEALSK